MNEPYDIFKQIVAKMPSSPRFVSDNWEGVRNLMAKLGYDKTQDGSHYPLIVLDTNYSPTSGDIMGANEYWTARLYFIDRTQADYSVEDRNDNSFKANIYPLINEFLYFSFRSTLLIFDSEPFPRVYINQDGEYVAEVPQTREKLPFLKGKDVKQNQLNAIVDAVALEISIKIRKTNY